MKKWKHESVKKQKNTKKKNGRVICSKTELFMFSLKLFIEGIDRWRCFLEVTAVSLYFSCGVMYILYGVGSSTSVTCRSKQLEGGPRCLWPGSEDSRAACIYWRPPCLTCNSFQTLLLFLQYPPALAAGWRGSPGCRRHSNTLRLHSHHVTGIPTYTRVGLQWSHGRL